MDTSRRILKNMFSLTIAEVVNKGIAFFTVAYLARILLTEGYGAIGWANSIVVYFTFLVNLGFDTVGIREISKNKDNAPKYVNSIISMKVIMAFILYSILFVSVWFFNKPMEIKYVVWIAGINIFSNALLLNWFFMSIEKMEIIALRQLVTGILNLSGMMIFVHNQNDIVLAMIVTVSALLLNSLWMLVYYIKYYNKLKFHYDLVFWKELLKASLPIAMTFFITLIYNYVSIQILGFTRNFHEAGIYNSAFQALVVTLIPLSIIQNAFFPLLSRSETRENRESVFKKFSLLIYIIGSILTVGFFTFSPEIIHIIFGNKFSEAGPILRILMISGMVMYLNVSLSQPLVAWKKERQVFYAMLAGGIVSLILNAILIPILGPKGAAFASISTELVVFTGQSIIFYKLMKKFYVSKLFVCLGLAVVACIAGKYLSTIGIHAIISGIISFGIYVSFIFLFRITSIGEIKNYLIKK